LWGSVQIQLCPACEAESGEWSEKGKVDNQSMPEQEGHQESRNGLGSEMRGSRPDVFIETSISFLGPVRN